jgi:hypothetical protein
MKKVSMLLCAGVLMSALCAAFTACNDEPQNPGQQQEGSRGEEQPGERKDEPTEVGIAPVPTSEIPEVTAFFEENLRLIAESIPADRWGDWSPESHRCLMINGVDELQKADRDGTPFKFQYPDIDFDAYTLIIGMHTGVGLSAVVSHSIVVEQEVVTMTVRRRNTGEAGHWGPKNDYYWGFYPKLSEKSIINIVTIHEN